ncbi:LON peptidase substrate-binding domain-containing protein [Gemmata sp. JC717]|uniref:LON peptidase substrate-binding domain-containing protein n=1 Tax=Gemmata algarum TaxID=2975278 RepID=UPI0021BAE46F|nr:LON peptidase substrate-binding domain-containing protein [Gemmata algarum]MDY3553801.1 LON peptidase substrate-binding domain-containing protein [Gemmata algarum]
MSANELDGFSGTVRLFPLPGLVVFPHVVQALHIFEPRYRRMTADALAGDGLIAMATLSASADEPADRPAIEPVVCVGRIVWHEKHPGGKYDLRLRGLSRARVVEELGSETPYRTARVELIRDTASTDLSRLTELRRALAAAVLPRFEDGSPAQRQLGELFDGDAPLGQVCDVLAFALPLPPELKLALLAEPLADRRATAIADALRVSAARAERPFPPPFSAN